MRKQQLFLNYQKNRNINGDLFLIKIWEKNKPIRLVFGSTELHIILSSGYQQNVIYFFFDIDE